MTESYFFNSYKATCSCSIYLDYKIADFTTTPITALMLGHVLPTNLELNDKKIEEMCFFTKKYLEDIRRDEDMIDVNKNIDFCPFINGCNNISKIPY